MPALLYLPPFGARGLNSGICDADNAAWKIDGLVVTPTTLRVAISSARLPDSIRSRDRSSSHTETPWAERAASRAESSSAHHVNALQAPFAIWS